MNSKDIKIGNVYLITYNKSEDRQKRWRENKLPLAGTRVKVLKVIKYRTFPIRIVTVEKYQDMVTMYFCHSSDLRRDYYGKRKR